MKRFVPRAKRLLAFALTLAIVFSMFSGITWVNAANVINITFEVIDLDKPEGDPSSPVQSGTRLIIEGLGFENPIVRAGEYGTTKLNITRVSEDKSEIIIEAGNELDKIIGVVNKIRIYNNNGAEELTPAAGIDFDLTGVPSIKSVSKVKAYVGDTLNITGTAFDRLNPATDSIFISGSEYPLSKEADGDDGNDNTADIQPGGSQIVVNKLQQPNVTGLNHVRVVRKFGLSGGVSRQIVSQLRNSIMVVNKLTGIVFDRIDPNSGPTGKQNLVNIYVSAGGSNLSSNMRIFVQSIDSQNNVTEVEATNLGTIQQGGTNIGLKVRLSEAWKATGVVDIVLTSPDRGSEFVIPKAYTYVTAGNSLSIDGTNGIVPNFKKETELKDSIISGRNIGFFSNSNYDKVLDAEFESVIGYSKYKDFPELSNISSYKVKYTATYDENNNGKDSGDPNVTIIREIWVTIGAEAKIQNVPGNIFSEGSDKITVRPYNPTINEPLTVDVKIETLTTIFKEDTSSTMTKYYSRSEDVTLTKGYTYYPDEIYPFFQLDNITPAYGPNNQEIYMTIKGKDFEVLEDGAKPYVRIGGRVIAEDPITPVNEIMVFDDNNKLVDGKIIKKGTKLKFRLPAVADGASGGVDVVVTNPSGGQWTVVNGFEFRNPTSRPAIKMPIITQLKEAYADMRGGIISGETVLVTGENFDTSADEKPRIVVTIDGEKATVMGKVTSDGKTVTIIPPPGTVAGDTQLQLINEDGSMYSVKFVYNLITSNPKIKSIVPTKGGNGTKLIIKGEDFVLPDKSVPYNDPKFKGSVVILNGIELNAYKYTELGDITNDGSTNIYFENNYDPDGDPLTNNSYYLNGNMVEVQDITTIYVDIPDRYYTFDKDAPSNLKWTQIPLGSLKVEVLNPDGAKSKEDIRFNYMNPATAPTITSVTPDSGSVDGGTVVTIIGSDFRKDNLEVYFGPELSKDVQFINSGMLRALVPKYPYVLPAGKDELMVPVMVVNFDGGSAVYYDKSADKGFKYRVPGSHPIITNINPKSRSAAGGDIVDIIGQDFRRSPDMNPAGIPKVYFNGREATVYWPDDNKVSVSSMRVKTPPSTVSGPVEVVLVNYDSGTYTYKGFSYVMSKPVIDTVMPNAINKKGNINVQINGKGFRQGGTSELFTGTAEKVGRHLGTGTDAAAAIDAIVSFGDETTGDKRVIDTVIGTPYVLMGELRIDTEIITTGVESVRVKISLASDGTHTALPRKHADTDADPDTDPDPDTPAVSDIVVGSSHLFIINHKMDLDSEDSYDEGILVETTPSSVTITRRIAPYVKTLMQTDPEANDYERLDVKSPPIGSIGPRNLYIINDDKGTATSSITIMNPDSSPVINRIDPKNKAKRISDNQIEDYNMNTDSLYSEYYTYVPLEGGAFLTISGADFRRNVKVYLNDMPLEIVSKSLNDDQLVVKIPKGSNEDVDKDYRIVVVNSDGGTYDSTMMAKPHYIRYIAPGSNNPVITKITPDKSSSRGANNWIHINGSGFRQFVKVLVDGEPCFTERSKEGDHAGSQLPSDENIYFHIPAGTAPGIKTIQVQNTDYGFVELKNGLTVISSPEITRVLDDKGMELNPLVLSVEGGEVIKLEGIQFYDGAAVIFGGVLKAKSELANGESGTPCLNINNAEMVIVGGTSVNAKLETDGSLTCTTPKLSVGDTSVLVLNKDGGVSNVIIGSYDKPVPDTPGGLSIEPVDGDTMKLEWTKLDNIAYYEIFIDVSNDGKRSDIGYQYLGSIVPTEIASNRYRYFIDGLTPSTWYSVKLKSVNLFGASRLSEGTSYKKTLDEVKVGSYQFGNDVIGGISQGDQYIIKGKDVTYYIGENTIKNSTNLNVDFEKPAYLTTDSRAISISYRLIDKYPDNKIKMSDRDVELNMKLVNLHVDEILRVESSAQGDTAVKVSIEKSLGARGDEIKIKLPRGYRSITSPFGIDLSLQIRNETSRVKNFNGDITMMLKYAETKKALYPGGVYIAYYNSTTKSIEMINTQNLTGKAQGNTLRAGEYVLIGKLTK